MGMNSSVSARRNHPVTNLRFVLLAACLGWFTQKFFKSDLLPHGPARKMAWEDRPTYAAIDSTNDSMQMKHGKLSKVYERVEEGEPGLLKGPETVFFDDRGDMYTITRDANLIRLEDFQTDEHGETTARAAFVKDVGVGSPLGAKFTGNTLYIADAVLGLTRIRDIQDPKSKLEIVTTMALGGGDKKTRIVLADDVAIGPKTGNVYFTDATEVYARRDPDLTWDVMYASKVEALQGPSGRLLNYNPNTDETAVLASGLSFANGVSVDQEEKYIIFAESFSLRIGKYHLSGEKEGTIEYIVDGKPSPAYFDGVDCAWKDVTAQTSLCYAVCPSAVVPAQKVLMMVPHPFDIFLRTLFLLLPKKLAPPTKAYAGIMVLDPESGNHVELIQDPAGKDISRLTGITVHDNKLYLGSLHNNYIGVYDLN